MAGKEEVQDTDDYVVDKRGRKHKAHRIVFNKGEDDGKKGVSEQMKKTFSTFVEQHTPELTEEELKQLEEELNEVLGKSASAGEWIHDFVHSDNPKFAGKSKEKRKQMALAAYYAKQRNEEVEIDEALKGGQVKLDKNKNGKLDKQDFKLLRKEEQELDEAVTVDKKNYSWGKMVTVHHGSENSYPLHPEHQSSIKNLKDGEHTSFKDETNRKVTAHREGDKVHLSGAGSNKKTTVAHSHFTEETFTEGLWPGTPEYKKKYDNDRVTGAGARHDIKKTATGVIATRRFSDNDEAEKPKGEPKRGRGRPKKDKFAEAIEFLMDLDEETFDSLMEEGFDSFMEHYEQLDEISKATLGSYIKKASRDAVVKRKIGSDFENLADKARKPGMKASATSLADKWKAKSWKRSHGVNKAVDRLTK